MQQKNTMIKYLIGDVTDPKIEGNKLIIHICNDIGKWGRGFVLSLSNKWKEPENEYKLWSKKKYSFRLGEVQFVQVDNKIMVANMIAQKDIKEIDSIPPIRYEALEKCLIKVKNFAKEWGASIHMPKIGTGLAGGKWEKIEPIINNMLVDNDISTYVYILDIKNEI